MGLKQMKEKENIGIDYFRIIAAILVITIHTSPLLSVNETADFILTRILARSAVPFFFMATGFFLFPQNNLKPFKYNKSVLKIVKLYGIAILLYLPLNFYAGYFADKAVPIKILKDILFDGTFYHLWYFPAVILGIGVIVFLIKHCRFHIVGFITVILYLIGLFGDSYYGVIAHIPFLKAFYDILFLFSDYTRNGLFFAPLYLFMGIWLSTHRRRYSFKIKMVGFLLSLALMMAEGLLLHHFSIQRHDSMYIALIPCMYFLFQLLLFCKGKSNKNLRTISMLIFIIHPWCIVLIRGFAKIIKAQSILIDNSIIHFIAVTFLSIIVAVILNKLWNKLKMPSFQEDRAWVEINLSNLHHNVVQLKNILPKGCEIMAVVKANAYGHGDVRIASELQKSDVNAFAVASLSEGIHLRKNGIKGTILILGYTCPQEAAKLVRYHLTQTIIDYNYAVALNQYGKKIKTHIKIDTGMNRLGENFNHIDEIAGMFHLPNLIIDGMYTHLSSSDSMLNDDINFTIQQIENFYSVVNKINVLGYYPPKIHIQSTYGVLNYPELNCSYARIGVAIYGLLSNETDQTEVKIDLHPVLSIKARVSIVKNISSNQPVGYGRKFISDSPMKIATVAIGYADGIPRNITCGSVLIKGEKVPIIGNICMDQLTIDVTNIPEVCQGDIVTIIGQDCGEIISGEQAARQAGTITNELFSRLGERLERVYIFN